MKLRELLETTITESTLSIDVPNEEWLQDKINYATKKGRNDYGVPYMGSTTASVRGTPPKVRVMRLASLRGMRREQTNVRHKDLKWLMDYMDKNKKLPPMGTSPDDEYLPYIMVAYNGEAWVNEGNHRIMAAYRLGWDTMPIEIRYFDGGERVEDGPMYPGKIGLGNTPKVQGVAEGLEQISIKARKGHNKFATELSVDGKTAGVYQYDANSGRSIAEVYPEYRGKGFGKILVLHAIYTAAKLGMDFVEDESRTAEYDNVLDSLDNNGLAVNDDGYWYVTGEGEQYLKQRLKQGVAEGATVTRIDSKPITDFGPSLKAYKHTDDWSQSGVDTGDDSYWKNKNLKTNTTKGLFAGDPKRTALYATGNAHETRYVEFTQNGQPIVYFDQKDLPAMRSRKTYLTVFDANDFRQLPTGEWFSENPGKPIKQIPIGDPFKYIASQGWIVRVTDDLDKVFKQVKNMHKAGKIAQYGAEGMNESKQGVAEGNLKEFAPVSRGPWGDDDESSDDPYKHPKPRHYGRSIDFFGQFEADHFDREDMDDATGVFKGYWSKNQIAYFKFDNPQHTDSEDPGMGWYYEPESNGNSDTTSTKPAVDNSDKRKQQELGMIRAFLKSGQKPKPGSQIYSLMKQHGMTEARSNPEQNVKPESGMKELIANYKDISDIENWAISMTAEPKLGINPQVGISEDTPKGIYFYPLDYAVDMARRGKKLPWGDNMPYIQLFQYNRSGEMTKETQVDPAKLKQALRQYCSEEVIQSAIDDPEYDGTPYWFIYDCLSRLGKSDETNIIRWNKVLRDLGFTSVFDDGSGWIAYGEPTQGVVLDPRIIKQHKTISNKQRSRVVTPAVIEQAIFDTLDIELAANRAWQKYDPDGSKLRAAAKEYAKKPEFKQWFGKPGSEEIFDKAASWGRYGARELSQEAWDWYKEQQAQQPVKQESLDEAPLADYEPLGDFTKPGPFTGADKKLIPHPANQLKAEQFFSKTPYDIRLFFSNITGTGKYSEYGVMAPDVLKIIFGDEADKIINGHDDAITVVYVGNKGDSKKMLTPWVMAHRLGHAIQAGVRSKGLGRKDPDHPWARGEDHFFKAVNSMLEEHYGKRGTMGGDLKYELTPEYNALFNAMGTQRSSRSNEIRRPYEFLYEIFAQYLGTGKVTFNPLPANLAYGRKAWGNPTKYMNIKPEYKEETDRHQIADQLAYDMELMFNDVLSQMVGKILVM